MANRLPFTAAYPSKTTLEMGLVTALFDHPDQNHPLDQLAQCIDWVMVEQRFEKPYSE